MLATRGHEGLASRRQGSSRITVPEGKKIVHRNGRRGIPVRAEPRFAVAPALTGGIALEPDATKGLEVAAIGYVLVLGALTTAGDQRAPRRP